MKNAREKIMKAIEILRAEKISFTIRDVYISETNGNVVEFYAKDVGYFCSVNTRSGKIMDC